MGEKLALHQLPDGSLNYGNGVIGPSFEDQLLATQTYQQTVAEGQHLRTRQESIIENLTSQGLVPVSSDSTLGRLLNFGTSSQVTRLIPLRYVILAAAIIGLLAACKRLPEAQPPQSGPTEPAGTIKPINPNQIFAEKPRGGAARPAEAQKPATQGEAPKTMTFEQQAKTAALGSTLNLLGNPQVSQNQQRLDSKLLTPITAFPFSKIVEDQVIPPDADFVRVRWVFTTPGFRGMTKVFGEGEIKNFKLKTASILPITPADRANGIQWMGIIKISSIYRYRAVKPWFFTSNEGFKSGGQDTEWAKAVVPEPTIPFTPWIDGKLTIPVLIINDKWRPQKEGEIVYPILPALYMNDEGGCRPDGRSPIPGCEVVRLKWEEN